MRQQAQHRDFFNLAAKLCVLAAQNLFDILFFVLPVVLLNTAHFLLLHLFSMGEITPVTGALSGS